jgi:hypothetical protein
LKVQPDVLTFQTAESVVEQPELSKLFRYAFKPEVIGIIQHDRAIFPFCQIQDDVSYPPSAYKRLFREHKIDTMKPPDTYDRSASAAGMQRRASKSHRPSSLMAGSAQQLLRRRSTRKQSSRKVDQSCSSEFYDTLPPFCFPGKVMKSAFYTYLCTVMTLYVHISMFFRIGIPICRIHRVGRGYLPCTKIFRHS